MLVPPEEDTASDPAQLAAAAAIVSNANMETLSAENDPESLESERLNSTLLTQQSGGQTSHVWINGEFRTRLYTQSESKTIESPQDSLEDEISDSDPAMSGTDDEEA